MIKARDGAEALELFDKEKRQIDLVILDMVMPDLSGTEVYSKLSEIKPDLPVIFVTGYDVHAEMTTIESKSEHVSVLQKPYTQQSLGRKVRQLLG